MNAQLANILRDELATLPFIDLAAGLAKTVEIKEPVEGGATLTKRFPVWVSNGEPDTCSGAEISLIPDSSKRGILYFEDGGVRVVKRLAYGIQYTSTLRLVCWLNGQLITGQTYKEISAEAITDILGRLVRGVGINRGAYTRLKIVPLNIAPMDAAVFSRYTYDETVMQYLRPPFEFFAVTLQCEYVVPFNCIKQITVITTDTCAPAETSE